GEAPGDRLGAVGRARAQAPLELGARRWQDEDADALRALHAYLARALPVDREQDIVALCQQRFDRGARGPLEVAVDVGVLVEGIGLDHPLEYLARNEMVVAPVHFARPRQARGVGNRKRDVALALDKGLDEAGLAGTGRRRDHVEGPGRRRAHSRFCTCSRICSISTLSST